MSRDFLKIEKCFDYLRANAGHEITFQELLEYTSWSENNLETNISKRIREFLIDIYDHGVPKKQRKYLINRNILNVDKEDFFNLFRQKNRIFTQYEHQKYNTVRIYEFYLPLTNENLLRQNLDDLFYRDTLNRRLKAINIDELTPMYNQLDDEKEEEYFDRLTNYASDLFWGYSISHVAGRFRTSDPIMTKVEAAKKTGKAYLVDETTAVVRFIFPYEEDQIGYHENLDKLFQVLFVKAITEATPNEDQIWLLESFGSTILHKYVKISME